ncbi:MAG: D-alanyl-D-alanine carboxypeptidase [Tyzzerella sp.]|nr:D-alanyl-D-alanine carboxypeptidase [Tyzzerella sp.]
MKKVISVLLSVLLFTLHVHTVYAEETGIEIEAPSAILVETSTGKIIYEKNATERLAPASVTKIMTMLLIFDALEEGKIQLEDTVTVSEYAASMGGSQVFLEVGETQTVDTMLKCIAVASANDACVAMAEHICGSADEFVNQMNERAQGLGMADTTFMNCNGLDEDGHLTTASDIAKMSRELITKYPQVRDYVTIWMEDITHTTRKGTSTFGLSNTNKLIRQYQYATGLKTGSTSIAKFCVSATAEKDGIELIAVILAAPDSKIRFQNATELLNYGFGKCSVYEDDKPLEEQMLAVERGTEKEVKIGLEENFRYVDTEGIDTKSIERVLKIPESQRAPIEKGDEVGTVQYLYDGTLLGEVPVVAKENVDKMNFKYALQNIVAGFLL